MHHAAATTLQEVEAMSYHWENVIWQSKDGSWSHGFYTRISMGSSASSWDDEDYDSEWDDEFDFSSFDYVRSGFATDEDASRWQPTGNPGGHTTIHYAGNSRQVKELDQLAHWHRYPEDKKKHDRRELLRKNREHFAALAKQWTPDSLRAALADSFCTLRATLKSDEKAYELYGMSNTAVGRLKQDGDWLKIDGKRIYNLKTDKFEKHVHSLERTVAPQYGYGRRW